MSLAEFKEQILVMSTKERTELQSLLSALDEASDSGHRKAMSRKIDDNDPTNWVDYDDCKAEMRRLDSAEPD